MEVNGLVCSGRSSTEFRPRLRWRYDGDRVLRAAHAGIFDFREDFRWEQIFSISEKKSMNGSAIREGFLTQPELVGKSAKELAKIFDIAVSTMYYYLSQLKKAGYLKPTDEGIEIVEEVFDEEEILENLVVRGSHKLLPYWRFERFESGEPIRLKGSGEILKGCIFFDELEPCRNKCQRVKQEIKKGYLVFVSPYFGGGLKSLDEDFRKRFIEWFMKRQEGKRTG